jgi:hypothetical protein
MIAGGCCGGIAPLQKYQEYELIVVYVWRKPLTVSDCSVLTTGLQLKVKGWFYGICDAVHAPRSGSMKD